MVSWENGTIRLSEDAGRTWRTIPGPPIRDRPYPFQLAFSNPRHGAVLEGRYKQSLLWIADAGETWEQVPAPPIEASEIFVTDDALAVAYAGRSLAITEDAGAKWEVHALPFPQDYCRLDATALRTFWMYCRASREGAPSSVLVSNDGAGTWTRYALPEASTWASIAAVSEREAWLSPIWFVGNGLWRTTDGGATWVEVWPKLPLPGW
jgi:photosystem II stability/assembly factor-like uncharacterized protein